MAENQTDGIVVRQAETPAEIEEFFRLSWSVLEPDLPPEHATSWRDDVVKAPGFDRSQLRCAFRGGQMIGTCVVYERVLRMGPARLPTGCVGGVATHPDHRRRGVAAAVMWDAIAYAQARRHALLLLDGISDFYGRFGYVDVHDLVWHAVDRKRTLALPASAYRVRQSTLDDVPALLALYRRHFGRYHGSFERSPERQAFLVERGLPDHTPTLAVDADGQARGYLDFSWEHHGARAAEVAADDWPAALALLQHHAHLFDGRAEPPAELLWPLPLGSPAFYALADRLPLRTEIERHPDADWLARPAHLPTLLGSLVPLWQARWERTALAWTGRLGIRLGPGDSAACVLDLSPGRVEPVEGHSPDVRWAALSPEAFTRLVFGYRTVEWAASQPDQRVPDECRPALEVLFAPETFWIAGSDSF